MSLRIVEKHGCITLMASNHITELLNGVGIWGFDCLKSKPSQLEFGLNSASSHQSEVDYYGLEMEVKHIFVFGKPHL